jgi:hypothetical protein
MELDLRKFKPLTDSLDLVQGECSSVAEAVCNEVRRYTGDDSLSLESKQFTSIAEVFDSVQTFANVPLTYFILPTHSPWTVLWFDSFLCDGYDSLCSNLAKNYNFNTLHWNSSDTNSRMLRGSSFTHRQLADGKIEQRSVYCAVADSGRWHFEAHGVPLSAEDLSVYTSKRKADRLNERVMTDFLGRLGAFPWASKFYALPEKPVYIIRRRSYPSTIITKNRHEIFSKSNSVGI